MKFQDVLWGYGVERALPQPEREEREEKAESFLLHSEDQTARVLFEPRANPEIETPPNQKKHLSPEK